MAVETITVSSVASPEPLIVTIESGSNEPTIPYGSSSQHPFVPNSLNDLKLPPHTFNVLATMAVIRTDEENSPQSPEPSVPSQISTPPMNVSTIQGWETTHTTTDDNNFFPRMSLDGFIGIILLVKFLTPMSPDMYLSLQARPPHHRLHDNRRESGAWRCLLLKKEKCRSTPVRYAASPYHPKRHPDAQEKLKH